MKTRMATGCCLVLAVLCASPSAPQAQRGTMQGWDWNWGELFYGRSYQTTLTIKNTCPSPELVRIDISGPPKGAQSIGQSGTPVSIAAMLSIPSAACVGESRRTCRVTAPSGETELELVISTPPAPDLAAIPAGFTEETLFDELGGELQLASDSGSVRCIGQVDTYTASGHVHVDPDPAATQEGFKDDRPTCRDYWETERRPPGLDEDCTDEIRSLATSYRRDVLEPLVAASPKDWAWLPSVAQIQEMSIDELLAMKARAEGQRE